MNRPCFALGVLLGSLASSLLVVENASCQADHNDRAPYETHYDCLYDEYGDYCVDYDYSDYDYNHYEYDDCEYQAGQTDTSAAAGDERGCSDESPAQDVTAQAEAAREDDDCSNEGCEDARPTETVDKTPAHSTSDLTQADRAEDRAAAFCEGPGCEYANGGYGYDEYVEYHEDGDWYDYWCGVCPLGEYDYAGAGCSLGSEDAASACGAGVGEADQNRTVQQAAAGTVSSQEADDPASGFGNWQVERFLSGHDPLYDAAVYGVCSEQEAGTAETSSAQEPEQAQAAAVIPEDAVVPTYWHPYHGLTSDDLEEIARARSDLGEQATLVRDDVQDEVYFERLEEIQEWVEQWEPESDSLSTAEADAATLPLSAVAPPALPVWRYSELPTLPQAIAEGRVIERAGRIAASATDCFAISPPHPVAAQQNETVDARVAGERILISAADALDSLSSSISGMAGQLRALAYQRRASATRQGPATR